MPEAKPFFVDRSNDQPRPMNFWAPLVVTAAELEAEAARLGGLAIARGGRRSLIVHPSATAPGLGFAPGIEVSINVLPPGESTVRYRQNSSQVAMCIRGAGLAIVGSQHLGFAQFDVWNVPSMEHYRYENRSREAAVFLNYSNAPLLEKLEVHYVEEDAAENAAAMVPASPVGKRAKDFADDIAIGADGARLLGYEHLIDIDVVPSRALLWPWREVERHLGRVEGLGGAAGEIYRGRHLYLLYNPATERRNGTTHSFFATLAQYPPNRVDIPHRHSSAAINYIFGGSGRSVVGGHRFEWRAGDIMLSAPAWAVHNHAAGPDGCRILTVQDHPLHIAMESLIWQETLKDPIVKLGSEVGAQTNLARFVAG